jgi:HJR/Mrr/RecB family endonuclease
MVLLTRIFSVPWQISLVLAVEVPVVMRWIAPAAFNTHALRAIGNELFIFAPAIALLFLVYAAVSYFLNSALVKRFAHVDEQTLEQPAFQNHQQPTEWSIELLSTLEWQRFEKVFVEYFRLLGKRVETVFNSTDGGIDARIYPADSDTLEYAVQCKAGNDVVGIKPIYELYGIMAHESAGKGIYLTVSTFSEDAKQFAEEHKEKIFLIDGQRFISMISKLPEEKGAILLNVAIEGLYPKTD